MVRPGLSAARRRPSLAAVRAVAAFALAVGLSSAAGAASDIPGFKKPRKAFPEGWDARMQFGASATSGAARTSSFSGGLATTYRGGPWELRFGVEGKRNAWKGGVKRVDPNGQVVLDEDGAPVLDVVRKRTFDRRFVEFEPRWFFRQRRNYLFALIDLETNEPTGLKRTSRQIVGIGYSLVLDSSNWFTAGIGTGRKTDLNVENEGDVGGIGYVELAFARLLGERTKFKIALDSDFGSENRSTGLDLWLKWKLNTPISLKLDYEARVNDDAPDTPGPYDETRESSVTLSFEIDVF